MGKLCTTPNQHANKPQIRINDNVIKVNGYNAYSIRNKEIYPDRHNTKFNIITSQLNDLNNKSVLDLGCANGLFTLYTVLNDASNVTAVDIDTTHLKIIKTIKSGLNLSNLNVQEKNVADVEGKHDIVLALALIHWLYSCTTTKFGSLDKVVKWLSEMTNEYLIIEWIDAKNDTSVNWFDHTAYNKDIIEEEYSKENFDKAINKYFKSVKHIGDTNKFRKIYIAYK